MSSADPSPSQHKVGEPNGSHLAQNKSPELTSVAHIHDVVSTATDNMKNDASGQDGEIGEGIHSHGHSTDDGDGDMHCTTIDTDINNIGTDTEFPSKRKKVVHNPHDEKTAQINDKDQQPPLPGGYGDVGSSDATHTSLVWYYSL